MTSIEYFEGKKEVNGPRVLVIGAGRTGIEIAEKLGKEGYDVVSVDIPKAKNRSTAYIGMEVFITPEPCKYCDYGLAGLA